MAEIFISYKSERRKAAAHLAKILECFGYTVWHDYHLLNGGSFAEETGQRIREAKAVLVLWCRLSAQSEWVMREAAMAAKLGSLVPAQIEPCELSLEFASNYTDLSVWSGAPFARDLFPLLDGITLRVGRGPQLDYKAMRTLDEEWYQGGARSLTEFPLGPSAQPEEEPLLLTTPLDEPTLNAVAQEVHWAQSAERAKHEEIARLAVASARQRPGGNVSDADEMDRQAEVAKLAEQLISSLWGE
jgi:TIR domain